MNPLNIAEAKWLDFASACLHDVADPDVREEMQMVFYAGLAGGYDLVVSTYTASASEEAFDAGVRAIREDIEQATGEITRHIHAILADDVAAN